ncbi:hypothetical protein ILYODFUR_034393 [Ilyodon furcidens]|uniref:Uncharacterized protein n=1 Tax=Ilyodon furcidens TaxID=33524 RepID=A0ABV0VAB9_9TELE
MEVDGFVSPHSTLESPAVERRVAGTRFGFLGSSVLDATGGLVGSFSSRMTGEPHFVSGLHRTTPEPSASAEPEIDYEGLPQGAASSTHMLAGAVAGVMEHCLMYPIDCVKVTRQLFTKCSSF